MEYILMGIVSALNLIFIKFKFSKKRYGDATLDGLTFFLLTSFFTGSMGGMFVGMVASLVISIYLYFSPPEFNFDLNESIKNILKENDVKFN